MFDVFDRFDLDISGLVDLSEMQQLYTLGGGDCFDKGGADGWLDDATFMHAHVSGSTMAFNVMSKVLPEQPVPAPPDPAQPEVRSRPK